MLNYVLISEGTSDRVLIPMINWCIRQYCITDISPVVADFTSLKPKPKTVVEKLRAARNLYSNKNLFIVHRDSDNVNPGDREREINEAISSMNFVKPCLPIIPNAMTEAWLLVDERAIYKAVNNPNGQDQFKLPNINIIEKIRNPKNVLFELFISASGLSRRRHSSIDLFMCRQRCALFITEFQKMGNLSSFALFRQKISQYVDKCDELRKKQT